MQSLVCSLLLLLPLAGTAFAAHKVHEHSPRDTTYCYTQMWPTQGALQYTQWSTTTTCTKQKTTTVTTTSTPLTVSTTTSTITTTSIAPSTTDTATITSVQTNTKTDTSTSASTSTVSTSVTVSLAFTPIGESLPGASYDPSAVYARKKRDLDANANFRGSHYSKHHRHPQHHRHRQHGWPGPVHCWHHAGVCVTSTSTATSIVIAPTSTQLKRATTTSTFITTPGVNTTTTLVIPTTSTTTTTVTSISTTTTTSTSTTVPIAPSAACETAAYSNYANYVAGGKGIVGLAPSNLNTTSVESPANGSAFECCEAALAHPLASVWAWSPPEGEESPATCYIYQLTSCTAGQASSLGNVAQYFEDGGNPDYVLGNAACGEVTVPLQL